jgi:hypothetical protein
MWVDVPMVDVWCLVFGHARPSLGPVLTAVPTVGDAALGVVSHTGACERVSTFSKTTCSSCTHVLYSCRHCRPSTWGCWSIGVQLQTREWSGRACCASALCACRRWQDVGVGRGERRGMGMRAAHLSSIFILTGCGGCRRCVGGSVGALRRGALRALHQNVAWEVRTVPSSWG